jgi:hypothetical protein
MESERKLFEADKNLNRFAETLEDVVLAKETIAALDEEKARRLAKIEGRAKENKEKAARLAQEAREAQEKEMKLLEEQREATAKTLNIAARKKVNAAVAAEKAVAVTVKQTDEERLNERFKAVYTLKNSTEKVNAELAGMAARHNNKIAAAKKRLEDEKDTLLAKGLNPYVEFRKEELATEARNREQRMKDAVENNKRELAERMEKEAAFIAKQERNEKLARQYEQEHRASQGRTVVEERNHNYILSQTKGEMEVLDPLGKAARVYPSQIVEKRELTGMKKITAQIRESMGITKGSDGEEEGGDDFGETSPGKLLPATLLRTQSAPGAAKTAASIAAQLAAMIGDGESSAGGSLVIGPGMSARELSLLETLATQPGAMPGADKTAIELNLNGNDVEKKELLKLTVEGEGNLGNSNQLFNIASPKYKIPDMSKFERDALDRAKDRQKERIEEGVEQVAGGRTFHGPSFVSKPAELAFVDFDVGKRYKKRFQLTNVSYTFNSFKYLDFDDSVFDFFQVTFEKPGRMSAGMSCYIDIEFTPKVNKDIFTEMRFHTQTGPVEIPVKCLIKRCAPRVVTTEIDFGNVVMGQKLFMPIKINNTQAIPTRFTIVPLQPEVAVLPTSGEAEDGAAAVLGTGSGKNERTGSAAGQSRPVPEVEDFALEGDHIGSDPSLNQAELSARVRRVMTSVLRAKQKESPMPLSCKTLEGFVDGYGTASVEVQCAPLSLGQLEQKFLVIFEDVREVMESVDDLGQLVKREQMVVARTFGDEVPIYVAEEVMDLQCTLFDRIYRKKIVLKNRAKSAYRVIVKVAPMFASFVEVNPTMFFVQAKSSQSMNIKFAPTAEMLTKAAHFTLPYEEFQTAALSSLPIEIQVVNQEIPAYFILTSNVCASRIELSSPVMDFGKVYIGQKSTRKITIRNTSMLPQKTAFVRLRKEFLVQPNDGFALLLPNESMEFEISFGPQSAINYEVNVTLLTSFNDSYTVKVLAEGIEPPLALSASVVQMRTTYPGERVIENVVVRNQSRHTQCFQVMLPDKMYSWLSVSPAVMELAAGESGRLEVEFCPPADTKTLDPIAWHKDLTEKPDAPPSPFDEWLPDSGWVFGKGLYGQVQWVKDGARSPGDVDEDPPAVAEAEDLSSPSAAEEEGEGNEGGETTPGGGSNELSKDVAPEEWGVFSRWNLPILLRPRKRALDATAAGGTVALGSTAALGSTMGSPLKTGGLGKTQGAAKVVPSPLFLSVECAVTLPQLDSDTKSIDFGQVSVGTRLMRSLKLFNRSQTAIKLHSIGLNAVGPFTLIRPIKEIGPGEALNVLVECLPARPGLNIEVLEISAEDPERGGHRVTLTFRVQGLMPAVELEGLSPPPPNWSPRTGVVDFGHVLTRDYVVKKFTVRNRSTFAINAVVVRVPSFKLSPNQQAEMVERTSTGLPVFSIRPMNVTIPQGGSEEIEVTFRPDRGRFHPFREDLDIMIGETDEILRVGILGRSWDRQLIVVPDDPRDEPFANKLYRGTSSVEDALMISTSAAVRTAAATARASLQLKLPESPIILLEYPDPFSATASPSSYVEVGSGAADAGKGKAPAKGAPAAPVAGAGARQQVKRLVLSSAKVVDNRPGAGPGTYEIVLSPEAVASGLFALSVDKGALAIGTDVPVDITCTVPKPRSLGGIFVGSWKVFKAEVVLKGGWRGEGAPEENRIPVTLKAYVCL